ncbi:cytochrome c peroxidase [Lepidopterella palustris CBS 459.81]|uniref:Peroxidase n=1 Tax=Lepidopterella palustris CBS 459.81 TaxID=1314670 RepID=A0A8E2JFE3_9PEZI|nr:cytochrome c peroxidase [Lepidopterella palustris CBS 459.81]
MSNTGNYEAVRKSILGLLDRPEYDDGSVGLVLVRLTCQSNGHSAGTYDASTDTGGSNGAGIRYEAEGGDPANAGLQHARVFLEPISGRWTLAGCVAIEAMDGLKIQWLPGRTDLVDFSKLPPRGRLPDAAQGADHIVALSGAHSLGRCHTDRSGFESKWVHSPTRFSNQYFRLLMRLDWRPTALENGVLRFSHVNEDLGEELMMLPTDMALLNDSSSKRGSRGTLRIRMCFMRTLHKAFANLMELGIQKDADGKVLNSDNVKGGYISVPKKLDALGMPALANKEAELLRKGDEKFRARL